MAKHLRISGIVQGVGYRASFDAHARSLKLAGWVRNRSDGSVEAMVRGDEQALQDMIDWARRGPPAALVRNVAVVNVDDDLVKNDAFIRLPTE